MRLQMKSMLALIGFVSAVAQAANAQSVGSTSIRDGWVTVIPPEFHGAINNPLKGFRDYRKDGYGLLKCQYIKWNDIEVCEGNSVERLIADVNKITNINGKRFEDLNVKLVPRVYLDWNGSPGNHSTGPPACTPSATTARLFRKGCNGSWRSSGKPGTRTRASLPC